MSWKRMLRSTNSRVRLGVGLLLAALFCIQCTPSDARHEAVAVGAISGAGASADQRRWSSDKERWRSGFPAGTVSAIARSFPMPTV